MQGGLFTDNFLMDKKNYYILKRYLLLCRIVKGVGWGINIFKNGNDAISKRGF